MARIGIDVRKLHDYGIGTYIRHLVQGLSRLNTSHEFVLLHAPDDDLSSLPATMELIPEAARLYGLKEPFQLGATARRLRLDLLHCPHYVTPFRARCKLAVTIHDIIHLQYPEALTSSAARWYARFFLRRAARRAAILFTVSDSSRVDILKSLPARKDRIVVTPNGVDPVFFAPQKTERIEEVLKEHGLRQPYILYVGNNKRHKNLRTAIKAFNLFRRRVGGEWCFAFAGASFHDPREGAAMLRLVEEQRLADAVHFLGYLPQEELLALYGGASMFVFPSLYEGFGLPPLEAMAAGVPVISADRPAMPEILGEAALYADAEEEAVFAHKMEQVATDDDLRDRMIEAGRARAREFTWEKTSELTARGYARALEGA